MNYKPRHDLTKTSLPFDTDAIYYEVLIKFLRKCKKGEHGASADLYRSIRLATGGFSLERVGEVALNLKSALLAFKDDKDDFIPPIEPYIDACVGKLTNHVDIKSIVEVLDEMYEQLDKYYLTYNNYLYR